MDIDEIKRELGEDWDRYREILSESLRSGNVLLSRINEYLSDHSGKQLRPVLSLLASRSCGIPNVQSFACAAVSEMVHTATLLHDDVADNGDLRRGAPTVRAAFSPAASVLTGDFWLSRALFLLTEYCNREALGFYSRAMQELSEGELLQMEKADALDTTEADYDTIISCKTASLFIATMKSAAVSVGAAPERLRAISDYALHLGMAFQIRDDIFDYSPDLQTGKAAGSDLKERKITLPLLGALRQAPPACAAGIRDRIGRIEIRKKEAVPDPGKETVLRSVLEEVNRFVIEYDGISYAQQRLEEHSRRAAEALSVLPDTPARRRLIQLAEYLSTRKR